MQVLDKITTMSSQDVLKQIEEMGICEYGVYHGPLAKHLTKSLPGQGTWIAAALNNADTDYVLLDLPRENPEKVLKGLAIAAYAINAEQKILYLPEGQEALADQLKGLAMQYQTQIKTEFLDVRANKGTVRLHLVTAASLSDAFEGIGDDGIYVSVNGSQLKKVPSSTKIEELMDIRDVKAFLLGYRLHGREAAAWTVKEARIANGVIRGLTEKDCIVCETEKRLLQSRKQSCGKCVFCREGLIQLSYMQKEITEGRGKAEYLNLTEEIGAAMGSSTLCSMGQMSAEIARTAMGSFSDEYEAHMKKKTCPAGVCKSFVHIYIDPKLCIGCGECMDVCPKECITGKEKYIHMIDAFDCTKCGACMEACGQDAVVQTSGKLPKLPDRLTKVGRFKKK